MNSFPRRESISRDIRALDVGEVCRFDEWLDRYMRLENTQITDSELLLHVLVRSSREFESDFGVFGISEE